MSDIEPTDEQIYQLKQMIKALGKRDLDDRRNENIQFKVSAAEKEIVKQDADAAGMNQSDYIRHKLGLQAVSLDEKAARG